MCACVCACWGVWAWVCVCMFGIRKRYMISPPQKKEPLVINMCSTHKKSNEKKTTWAQSQMQVRAFTYTCHSSRKDPLWHVFVRSHVHACVWVCVSACVHAQQIASVYLVWGDSRKEGRLTSCRLQAPRHMVITQPHSTLFSLLTHTQTRTHADNASTWMRKQTNSRVCRPFQGLLNWLRRILSLHGSYVIKLNW